MKIVLTGYRGTGKSSVASALAALSGWSWLDTDDLIESSAGCSIAEIFAAEGEVGFRDRETEAVRLVAVKDECVLATGGGAILREVNRELLHDNSLTVWLRASVETIANRVLGDETTSARRPNLTVGGEAEIREILDARTPIYSAFAELHVDTDNRPVEEIAAEIWAAANKWETPGENES